MKPYWDHFYHQADIGIIGAGPTVSSAFAQAGLALTAVITELDKVRPVQEKEISIEAPELDILFFDYINEIIFLISTQGMLFSEYTVKIENLSLEATIKGEPIDVQKHAPAVEVKGATFSGLKVFKNNQGFWVAKCIVDV
ncbi:archease [Desulfohalobiaceae bacterium Ax17]|uniref:archease n=1 Tax=Desulfovulcanus ferrireducens TaxID=2831190 RepID=UPI00207BA494|nr:archease [Desulfovulcanus ferrireducens]MBT8762787.1 archease [Desulfovulcanus ferrireducens]